MHKNLSRTRTATILIIHRSLGDVLVAVDVDVVVYLSSLVIRSEFIFKQELENYSSVNGFEMQFDKQNVSYFNSYLKLQCRL